ncbi:MAG: hypothetical protein HY074_02860 [Deltaproteobacteria bacterium]|nr:hypothetical protein [Deltaproteobacteria bacterium]
MKSYILCANTDGAKVFDFDDLEEGAQLLLSLSYPKDAYSSVVLEMERMCGAGTASKLVLCGEPVVLNQLCQKLSDEVRGRIVGIIPESFSNSRIPNDGSYLRAANTM